MFQQERCRFLEKVWSSDEELQDEGFYADDAAVEDALAFYRDKIENAAQVTELLAAEAEFTKNLYKYAAANVQMSGFVREREADDKANVF